jgi:hypothetical protein
MHRFRPLLAAHPMRFGRGPERVLAAPAEKAWFSDDVKLFAATFLAGFLFVSILIG